MKLIEAQKSQPKEGPLQKFLASLSKFIPLGKTTQNAQDLILSRFQRALDHRFIMLRDIPLPSLQTPIPFVLVGPPGLIVINYRAEKGIYRAKEESWWEMSATTRQFQPAHQNLIRQTAAYAQALTEYLTEQGKSTPRPQQVLLFGHPGVHVDASHPAARIVLVDGVDHFLTSLLHSGEAISLPDVRLIAAVLERILFPEAEKPPIPEDIFGKDLGLTTPPAKPAAPKTPRPVPQVNLPPSVTKKFAFSRRQMVALVIMALLAAIVLGVFILIVVITLGGL
ncbi:MAG: NERD domain-containing protein [Anaerolineales bacterium]|nr:NERD domain-containing protein [Anaerolineales bacterium]